VSQAVIQVQGLIKQYKGKAALDGVDLNITAGGINALVGVNGSGKSTLFRLLMGLESPSAGNCSVFGVDSTLLSAQLRGQIGYVNDSHSLPEWLTVAQLVNMQKQSFELWQSVRFNQLIDKFNLTQTQSISRLSRGQRAGLNLAMVLAQSPTLLILDEPTLGLDVVVKQHFLQVLVQVLADSDDQLTVIYCSHQMDEIERLADNLIILEQGKVRFNQPPDEFTQRVSFWLCDGRQLVVPDTDSVLGVEYVGEQTQVCLLDLSDLQATQLLESAGAQHLVKSATSFSRAVAGVLASHYKVGG